MGHWNGEWKRDDLSVKEMDAIINKGAFNLEGGLWHSELIKSNLIDFFIPFLPLERTHVKQCIRADMKAKNKPISDGSVIDRIAKEMQYFPEDQKVFSKSGCKKVSSKVDLIVD